MVTGSSESYPGKSWCILLAGEVNILVIQWLEASTVHALEAVLSTDLSPQSQCKRSVVHFSIEDTANV